jgi:hypothetical protein
MTRIASSKMSKIEEFIALAGSRRWKFYHFTDTRNLDAIKQQGLLAMSELRRWQLPVVPGGNQWSLDADISKGMDRYVHLCFMSQHPMEYRAKEDKRIIDSKFLQIDPSVLRIEGVMISQDVSNKADAIFGPAEQVIEQIDLEVIYTKTDWKNSDIKARLLAAKKCEVLVPNAVPVEYIKNL